MIETNISDNSLCKVISITGVSNIIENERFKIYPNPVKDNLNIEFYEEGKKEILLISDNGSLIFHKQVNNSFMSIDLSEFKSGIYMLKLISDNHSIVKKIIKY
jgi:hypothetical protein